MYFIINQGIAESGAPCVSNLSNNLILLTDYLSITPFLPILSQKKLQQPKKMASNIQLKTPQYFCLENLKEFKNKLTDGKILRESIKSQVFPSVFFTTTELNIFTVKPTR